MLVGYRTGDVLIPQLDLTEALSVQTRHFIDCIDRHVPPQVDGHAGLRVVRLLTAATDSMRASGRPIELASHRCAV
jgi:hypothetical protein